MKKVKAVLNFGYAWGEREEILEFDDDVTDEEIEEEVNQWAWSFLNLRWEVTKE